MSKGIGGTGSIGGSIGTSLPAYLHQQAKIKVHYQFELFDKIEN